MKPRRRDARPQPIARPAWSKDTELNAAWLCTIGALTIDDLVFWPSGETVMRQAGGNSIYSALGARVWIRRVTTLTRVGVDYPVQQLERVMSRVEVVLVPVDAPSMSAWGLYEANGQRQWVPHPKSGTQIQMTPIPAELSPGLLSCRAFHLASMPPSPHLDWSERLRRIGAFTSADSIQIEVLGTRSTENERTHLAMLPNIDCYLPSAVEARALTGIDDPIACARALADRGPRIVAIKLGHEGSVVYDKVRRESAHVPAVGTAVDPTGAGDAFCGGFLAGYILSGDAVSAAQMAAVSASFAIEALGFASLLKPPPSEIADRLSIVRERTRVERSHPSD